MQTQAQRENDFLAPKALSGRIRILFLILFLYLVPFITRNVPQSFDLARLQTNKSHVLHESALIPIENEPQVDEPSSSSTNRVWIISLKDFEVDAPWKGNFTDALTGLGPTVRWIDKHNNDLFVLSFRPEYESRKLVEDPQDLEEMESIKRFYSQFEFSNAADAIIQQYDNIKFKSRASVFSCTNISRADTLPGGEKIARKSVWETISKKIQIKQDNDLDLFESCAYNVNNQTLAIPSNFNFQFAVTETNKTFKVYYNSKLRLTYTTPFTCDDDCSISEVRNSVGAIVNVKNETNSKILRGRPVNNTVLDDNEVIEILQEETPSRYLISIILYHLLCVAVGFLVLFLSLYVHSTKLWCILLCYYLEHRALVALGVTYHYVIFVPVVFPYEVLKITIFQLSSWAYMRIVKYVLLIALHCIASWYLLIIFISIYISIYLYVMKECCNVKYSNTDSRYDSASLCVSLYCSLVSATLKDDVLTADHWTSLVTYLFKHFTKWALYPITFPFFVFAKPSQQVVFHIVGNIYDGFWICLKWILGFDLSSSLSHSNIDIYSTFMSLLFVSPPILCLYIAILYNNDAPARARNKINEFIEAGFAGDIQKVKRIVSDPKFDINGTYTGDKNILFYLGQATIFHTSLTSIMPTEGISSKSKIVSSRKEIIKFLLNKDDVLAGRLTCINTRCGDTLYPLLMAIESNQMDIAELLINNGADVTVTDVFGRNALAIVLEKGNEYLSAANSYRNKDLAMALEKGNDTHDGTRIAKLLLGTNCANPCAALSYIVRKNMRHLKLDKIFSQEFLVDQIVRAGYDNDLEKLKFLIDPRVMNADSSRNLINGFNTCEYKINPYGEHSNSDLKLNGLTCLIAACKKNHTNVVQWMDECGLLREPRIGYLPSDYVRGDQRTESPLRMEIGSKVATTSMYINKKDSDGNTALMTAIMKKNFTLAKILWRAGADINEVKNNDGFTSMMLTTYEGFEDFKQILSGQSNIDDLVELAAQGKLLDSMLLKPEITERNVNGQHSGRVSRNEFNSYLSSLKDKDSTKFKSLHGETPLSAACRFGHDNVVSYLLSIPYLLDKVDVNAVNIFTSDNKQYGGYSTPLINAVRLSSNNPNKSLVIVKDLLKTERVDILFEDQFKESALTWARKMKARSESGIKHSISKVAIGLGFKYMQSPSIADILDDKIKQNNKSPYEFHQFSVPVDYDMEARIETAFIGPVVELSAEYPSRWTDNYNEKNKIGRGESIGKNGVSYKGFIDYKHIDSFSGRGRPVIIKLLESSSSMTAMNVKELHREIEVLSSFRECPFLIRLIGYSIEDEDVHNAIGGRSALVFEFASRGDLRHLLDSSSTPHDLIWRRRIHIALGIAKGINYLHNLKPEKIFHRAIKSSNVVLTESFSPKIIELGLSKPEPRLSKLLSGVKDITPAVDDDNQDYTSSPRANIKNNGRYVDVTTSGENSPSSVSYVNFHCPEYLNSTDIMYDEKCEVYSFGVILVELLTGKHPRDLDVPFESGFFDKSISIDERMLGDASAAGSSLSLYTELAKRCIARRTGAGITSFATANADSKAPAKKPVPPGHVGPTIGTLARYESMKAVVDHLVRIDENYFLNSPKGTTETAKADGDDSDRVTTDNLLCSQCKNKITGVISSPCSHPICSNCLGYQVRNQIKQKNCFTRQGLHIICTLCQENGVYSPYSDGIISSKCSDKIRELFFAKRDEASYKLENSKKQADAIRYKNEEEELSLFNKLEVEMIKRLNGSDTQIAKIAYHVNKIRNKFLLTSCPHCGISVNLATTRSFAVECSSQEVDDISVVTIEPNPANANMANAKPNSAASISAYKFEKGEEIGDSRPRPRRIKCVEKAGVAYRRSMNYNDRVDYIRGPDFGSEIDAEEVIKDRWLRCEVPGQGQLFLPMISIDDEILFQPIQKVQVGCQKHFCGWCINKFYTSNNESSDRPFGEHSSCAEHVKICPLNSWHRGSDFGLPRDFDRARSIFRETSIVNYLFDCWKLHNESDDYDLLNDFFDEVPLDYWPCPRCTYNNYKLNGPKCEVCEFPKPKDSPKPNNLKLKAGGGNAANNKGPQSASNKSVVVDALTVRDTEAVLDSLRSDCDKLLLDIGRIKLRFEERRLEK